MKKKSGFSSLLVFIFLLLNTNHVIASSCTIREGFVEFYQEGDSMMDNLRNKIVNESMVVVTNTNSVCGFSELSLFSGYTYSWRAQIVTCNEGRESRKDCDPGSTCIKTDSGPQCINKRKCIQYPPFVSGDIIKKEAREATWFYEGGCKNNSTVHCNTITGEWYSPEPCKENQTCVLNQGVLAATAVCKDNCEGNISVGQIVCENNKLLRCNGNKEFVEENMKDYFGVDGCIGCTNENGIIKCLKTNSTLCSRIKVGEESGAKEEDVDDTQIVGSHICDSTHTYLYVCKENTDGFYTYEEQCDEKCGIKKGETDERCITEKEFNDNEQNLINITTTTSDAFWCVTGESIDTAIGCIPITVNGMVEKLLPTIFGIAGGIAFLMMVYGFIMISTSSGDEKKVAEAKKIVTSAITGLLFSLFSLFLYRLIAVDILHIPGI